MLSIFQDQEGLQSHYIDFSANRDLRAAIFAKATIYCKREENFPAKVTRQKRRKERKNFTLVAKVSALLTQKRRKRDD